MELIFHWRNLLDVTPSDRELIVMKVEGALVVGNLMRKGGGDDKEFYLVGKKLRTSKRSEDVAPSLILDKQLAYPIDLKVKGSRGRRQFEWDYFTL